MFLMMTEEHSEALKLARNMFAEKPSKLEKLSASLELKNYSNQNYIKQPIIACFGNIFLSIQEFNKTNQLQNRHQKIQNFPK